LVENNTEGLCLSKQRHATVSPKAESFIEMTTQL
jgi:hypothetical protein